MMVINIHQVDRPLAYFTYRACVDTLHEAEQLVKQVLSKRLHIEHIELIYIDDLKYEVYGNGELVATLDILSFSEGTL